eukprot:CAMPEP_0115019522 /NCGR_PEP_ID=MMETSP0216-20121206/29506_1 /TAXON_ID=223996 /ORGANISM="Protocruzia adherens, Strain Boccale" /LENGTH=1238 /DNA_ID=CAMNT_0002391033 /DNA_START=297 /DNA_END=4013 /DNA_ORIENTATION=+
MGEGELAERELDNMVYFPQPKKHDHLEISYVSDNGLVTDPALEDYELRRKELWTLQDIKDFLKYFFQAPKDFSEIASQIENKTTNDVINFYYLHKFNPVFKKYFQEVLSAARRPRKRVPIDNTINEIMQALNPSKLQGDEFKNWGSYKPRFLSNYDILKLNPKFRSEIVKSAVRESRSRSTAIELKQRQKHLDNLRKLGQTNLERAHRLERPESNAKMKAASRRDETRIFGRIDPLTKNEDGEEIYNYNLVIENAKLSEIKILKQKTEEYKPIYRIENSPKILNLPAGRFEIKESQLGERTPASSSTRVDPGRGPGRRTVNFWQQEEKLLFVEQFKIHGRKWKKIAEKIPNKTEAQIRNYFQNYRSKLNFDRIDPSHQEDRAGGSGSTTGNRPGRPSKSSKLAQKSAQINEIAISTPTISSTETSESSTATKPVTTTMSISPTTIRAAGVVASLAKSQEVAAKRSDVLEKVIKKETPGDTRTGTETFTRVQIDLNKKKHDSSEAPGVRQNKKMSPVSKDVMTRITSHRAVTSEGVKTTAQIESPTFGGKIAQTQGRQRIIPSHGFAQIKPRMPVVVEKNEESVKQGSRNPLVVKSGEFTSKAAKNTNGIPTRNMASPKMGNVTTKPMTILKKEIKGENPTERLVRGNSGGPVLSRDKHQLPNYFAPDLKPTVTMRSNSATTATPVTTTVSASAAYTTQADASKTVTNISASTSPVTNLYRDTLASVAKSVTNIAVPVTSRNTTHINAVSPIRPQNSVKIETTSPLRTDWTVATADMSTKKSNSSGSHGLIQGFGAFGHAGNGEQRDPTIAHGLPSSMNRPSSGHASVNMMSNAVAGSSRSEMERNRLIAVSAGVSRELQTSAINELFMAGLGQESGVKGGITNALQMHTENITIPTNLHRPTNVGSNPNSHLKVNTVMPIVSNPTTGTGQSRDMDPRMAGYQTVGGTGHLTQQQQHSLSNSARNFGIAQALAENPNLNTGAPSSTGLGTTGSMGITSTPMVSSGITSTALGGGAGGTPIATNMVMDNSHLLDDNSKFLINSGAFLSNYQNQLHHIDLSTLNQANMANNLLQANLLNPLQSMQATNSAAANGLDQAQMMNYNLMAASNATTANQAGAATANAALGGIPASYFQDPHLQQLQHQRQQFQPQEFYQQGQQPQGFQSLGLQVQQQQQRQLTPDQFQFQQQLFGAGGAGAGNVAGGLGGPAGGWMETGAQPRNAGNQGGGGVGHGHHMYQSFK